MSDPEKKSPLRTRAISLAVRLLIIASLVALPSGGAAVALADSGNASAVAINTQNGSSVFKLTFAIDQVAGSTVTNQNAAVAYSSCTACQTVAISIQVLLISGSPTNFSPVNLAIAINQNCNMCDTLAAAYQFAVGFDTRLKFTADGRQQIADIRHQLEMLRNSGLTGPEIDAKVNALMTQLGNVLQTQLVGFNQPAGNGTTDGSSPAGGAGSTTPAAATPSDTGSPPESTTPTTTTTPTSSTTTTPTSSTTTPTTTTPQTTTTSPGSTTTTP